MIKVDKLSSVDIQGFQAHEDLGFSLSDGVTTIVGPTDAGKSSVLRAVRWLVLNEPSGEAFIREGCQEAKVSIQLGKMRVAREKGGGRNTYELGGVSLQAVGTSLPEEVAAVVQMGEANFQGQYDRPFWLAETAGEVSRQLNRAVGLDVIDRVLAKMGAFLRESRACVISAKGRVEEDEKKRLQWRYAKRMDRALGRLEGAGRERDQIHHRGIKIGELIEGVIRREKHVRGLRGKAKEGKAVVVAGENWSSLRKRKDTFVCLLEAGIEQQKKARLPIPDLTGLDRLQKTVAGISAKRGSLEGLVERAQRTERSRTSFRASLSKKEQELKQKMGKVCPLCERPLDRE